MVRGARTRERILDAALELLRSQGFRALSMRAVSGHGAVSLGAIQFHFRSQPAFESEVLRWWGGKLSGSLYEAAQGSQGLKRVWSFCQTWASLPDSALIAAGVADARTDAGGHDGAGAMLLHLMRGWIDETVRFLRQAQRRGELRPEVDVRRAGIDLHRLLWSHSWSRALYGQEESARGVLSAAWEQLSRIAAEGEASLPPRPSLAGNAPRSDQPPAVEPSNPTSWDSLLEPGDPLYQAFLRHERAGNPRSVFRPPPVLPVDEAEAEKHRAQHGSA